MHERSETEVGVSFRDYSALVGAANLEFKLYEASRDGVAHPEAVRLFHEALMQYVVAQAMWNLKFVPTAGRYPMTSFSTASDIGVSFLQAFPAASKPADQGGALIGGSLYIDYMLPFYWRTAGDFAKRAVAQM